MESLWKLLFLFFTNNISSVAPKSSRLEIALQQNEGRLFKLRKITTNFFR